MTGLRIVAAFLLAGTVAAQGPAPSPAGPENAAGTQLAAGQDAFFALNGYTFMGLLRLRADGTFADYSREHLFVGIIDEGRWRQLDDGTLVLCSHYRHQPIEAGALRVWVREEDVAKLPALASALESRLDALPSKRRLTVRDLRPLVLRSWLWDRSGDDKAPAGSITPAIVGEDKTASRSDLVALTEAIRSRLANRDGALTRRRVRRVSGITWLAEPGYDAEKTLLEEYRRHQAGPFLPGAAFVAVDADTFRDLLGTRQAFLFITEMNRVIPREAPLEDLRRAPITIPACGLYEDLARPLPTTSASGGPRKH